jgi:hypothetical protein
VAGSPESTRTRPHHGKIDRFASQLRPNKRSSAQHIYGQARSLSSFIIGSAASLTATAHFSAEVQDVRIWCQLSLVRRERIGVDSHGFHLSFAVCSNTQLMPLSNKRSLLNPCSRHVRYAPWLLLLKELKHLSRTTERRGAKHRNVKASDLHCELTKHAQLMFADSACATITSTSIPSLVAPNVSFRLSNRTHDAKEAAQLVSQLQSPNNNLSFLPSISHSLILLQSSVLPLNLLMSTCSVPLSTVTPSVVSLSPPHSPTQTT